jgi:hypothetical protein
MKRNRFLNFKLLNSTKERLKARFFNSFSKGTNFYNNLKSFQFAKPLALLPLIIIPKIAKLEEDKESSNQDFTLNIKDVVRGEYENKIRTFASTEKKFLIFAKIKQYGDLRMTYFQFLDSLVPFQYIKTKPLEQVEKELLQKEDFNRILKLIDINGDGFINFEEYIVLSVFLSIPTEKYEFLFPKGLTKEELVEFLMNYISKDNENLKITDKTSLDGRIVKTDYNTLYKFMVDFVSKAFKNKHITIKELENFRFRLYYFLDYYEFYRIPESKADHISMENFARVLLSYVNIYKNKKLKRKIDEKEIEIKVCLNIINNFFREMLVFQNIFAFSMFCHKYKQIRGKSFNKTKLLMIN